MWKSLINSSSYRQKFKSKKMLWLLICLFCTLYDYQMMLKIMRFQDGKLETAWYQGTRHDRIASEISPEPADRVYWWRIRCRRLDSVRQRRDMKVGWTGCRRCRMSRQKHKIRIRLGPYSPKILPLPGILKNCWMEEYSLCNTILLGFRFRILSYKLLFHAQNSHLSQIISEVVGLHGTGGESR